jgi:outer membrane protein assembly factor BamB
MEPRRLLAAGVVLALAAASCLAAPQKSGTDSSPGWTQWRGPNRDGKVSTGQVWPDTLGEAALTPAWRLPLEESYSGPVVSRGLVFTTETRDKQAEVVWALDRKSGKTVWKSEWEGAMKVPFFAASNGSWIRSTPAVDGDTLYVAGMRDVLVALNASTGRQKWRVDFVKSLRTPLPAFGFVSSPLVTERTVIVQAGAAVLCLDKGNGSLVWRSMVDAGGMNGSAFSSPVLATVGGRRQLLVQTRDELAGLDVASGDILWRKKIPAFRGMNILTPAVWRDSIFTSSYGGRAMLVRLDRGNGALAPQVAWDTTAQGYMSSPVVIGDHLYFHQRSQRFACIDLATGQERWSAGPFGKYWSMVANKDRILALDQKGVLRLIRANPERYEPLSERKVATEETWAHLAVDRGEVFVRELRAITAFRWK